MENQKIVEHIETEKLKRYNGAYSPAFFYIDLPVVRYYDKIADSPSVTDLGIFVHEYIHYIQNITTYNGMFWSMVEYKKVSNIMDVELCQIYPKDHQGRQV